jgi:hypothetical protein
MIPLRIKLRVGTFSPLRHLRADLGRSHESARRVNKTSEMQVRKLGNSSEAVEIAVGHGTIFSCSGASCRAFARGRTLKHQPSLTPKPRPSLREDGCGSSSALKRPAPCPRGACGGSMLLGASEQGNAILCVLLRWAREKEHSA